VIADTGREKSSTWRYLEATARPRMAAIGLDIEIAPHSLARVDLYGHNGDLLIPAHTATGKLSAFCSNEWKQRVVARYLGHPKDAINWIGFTFDEKKRIKSTENRWFPLVEMMLTKADIRAIIRAAGWPDPVSSACSMCPNLDNAEWRHVRDNDFAAAVALDAEIREQDIFNGGSGVWLHHSRVALADADLDAEDRKGPARQCGLGMCFI
jgi:hypothetical protein